MGKDKGQKRKSWRGCPAWDPALRGSRRVCRSMLPFWRKRLEVGIVLRSSSVLCEAGGPRPRRGSMPRPWPSDERSGLGSARALPPEASASSRSSDSGISIDRFIVALIYFLIISLYLRNTW